MTDNDIKFDNKIIKEMKDTINEGKLKSIEIGFALCKTNDKKIILGKKVFGSERDIEPEKLNCDINNLKIGTFHTHPQGEPELSPNDAYHFYETIINCIGSKINNENIINCYTKKVSHNKSDKKITNNLMDTQEKILRNLYEKGEIGEELGKKYTQLVNNAENLYKKISII